MCFYEGEQKSARKKRIMLVSQHSNLERMARRRGLILLSTLFWIFATGTISAQNLASRGNDASATLRIRVNIAPFVYAKAEKASDSAHTAMVAYNIPVRMEKTESYSATQAIDITTRNGVVKALLITTTTILQ
ncbi:MAG: hypothetical protein DMG65_03510 [Candidatus Angelobacter sp. Gp1-AA117]|nr:MAG: hypothetical protein DMG65_03510 [Candidatus Angelobacter sp. Gp1-AA117]